VNRPALQFRTPDDAEERRLDHWLAEWLPDHTRSALKRWVVDGRVEVDRVAAVKAGQILKPGSSVQVVPPEAVAFTPKPEQLDFEILFEDDDLVVINKPVGLVVHPGHGRPSGTLIHGLLGRGISLSSIGAPQRPGIVHRLDRETTGVMVVAKRDAAHLALQRDFANRRIAKTYHALVWGRMREEEGSIEQPIGRSRTQPTKMTVRRGGRDAHSEYRALESMPGFHLLEVKPHTGRTHQIRVHLSHAGHPIVGDELYGGAGHRGVTDPLRRKALREFGGLALHAETLSFDHPASGEKQKFRAPRPAKFNALLDVLR
jgi:23S rRNA pseudouridine1911/1915/1917 synthase